MCTGEQKRPAHPQQRQRLFALAILAAALLWPATVWADQTAADRRAQRRTPVVEVFEAAKDSVVNISSTQIIQLRSPGGIDRLFEEFFDLPPRVRRFKQTSVGSGFVIHPAGYIVTNAHVVARTAERKVVFADKREYEAQIVALDVERDLAILKVDTDTRLKPIKLGASNDVMVGETVVAIGNPLGYQHTVTSGVVSALHRTMEIAEKVQFEDLIQTDASINPGNSGGPLLNVLGELIGINTAIRGDAQNIGFAIPVDHLREILPEMLDVERRYRINVGLVVEEFQTPKGPQLRITDVVPGSPAAKLPLKDKLVYLDAINGQRLHGVVDYHISLINRKPGEVLELGVRYGKSPGTALKLTIGARPRPDGARLLKAKFGIEAQVLSRRMARALGVPALTGFLVDAVEPDSPADRIALQRGDIIVQIGRHQPTDMDDLGELLEPVKSSQRVSITILRVSGRAMYRLRTRISAR